MGKDFKFNSILDINVLLLKIFTIFNHEILTHCGLNLASPATVLSTNANNKIDGKSMYVSKFSGKNLIFVGQLFQTSENIKSWKKFDLAYKK